MPRWWSGVPSSRAAVTDTASEDAAHMASISAAINQGTEQRHERQLKLRRLLTQVVIDAREEAGRCLSLVRTCVTERARFERAHKSPAIAAADAELAAVREAEGKARANEVPYQSALALALQDGSSNALPEYNAALPSGGASGEYEQLQSRARAAAARADAWVTHLIDEHKGLRFSVMLTARSLARANPIAASSEGAAADGAVLPTAEASAAATAAVENAKQLATANLIAAPSAEGAERETLATCRRRLANHLDRLRFAADVAQAVAGLQWAAAPPRAPAALPRAPAALLGPSVSRAPSQALLGPSVSRAPAPKLAPISASKPAPPRGAVASASTRPAADRSNDRSGGGRKRGAVDGAPEAAEGGASQAAGGGSSKRGRNNGDGGRKDADAGKSSPADVGDASSGASGGGHAGGGGSHDGGDDGGDDGGNDDGGGGGGGVTNDAMGGMEVEEEEEEDEEEEGEEMVMQLAAVEVPEDAHEDALGSAAEEAVDEAAVAEAADLEEPLTQELPSDESRADGADGGSEAAEQDDEYGEAAEAAGVAAEQAAAENGHGHDEDDEDEAREEQVPETAPAEPAPAGARPAPGTARPAPRLPSQAARREATVQGWVQELSAFNAPSRASAVSAKASRLAQELADVELLCDATAALREELESAAVSAASAAATLSAFAPPAAVPPTPNLDGPPSTHGTHGRAPTGQGNAKSDAKGQGNAKGKGNAKASVRRFDLFDEEEHEEEEEPPPPLPPPSAVRRSTVALGAATVAALKAALAALAPSDPRAWVTLADVCRFVCLCCVDTPSVVTSAKGAGRGGRDGGAGVPSSTPAPPPPDWKAYQQRFEDFFPKPSPPQKTLELPPPLAEARVQLRAYLYASASAPPGALLPPPPFTSARLDAFALVDAVALLEKGLTAKAARLGEEAVEARQAADAALAALATRGAAPTEAPLPFLLRLAAHHLAAAPVPGLSDGTAAIGAPKGGKGGTGSGNGATAPSAPVHSARVEPPSRAKRPMEGKAAVAAPKAKVARQSKVRA